MMKTPEQLKGAIRNLAKKKGIHAQEVLQIFMFERIIERLSVSPYKNRFILKGGLLISAILGVAERTTMDMDTTVKGLPMNEQSIRKAISEILDQTVDDGISVPALTEPSFLGSAARRSCPGLLLLEDGLILCYLYEEEKRQSQRR